MFTNFEFDLNFSLFIMHNMHCRHIYTIILHIILPRTLTVLVYMHLITSQDNTWKLKEVTYNKVFLTEGTKTFCIYQTHSPDIVSLTLLGMLADLQCLASLIDRKREGGKEGYIFCWKILWCDSIYINNSPHCTFILVAGIPNITDSSPSDLNTK